MLRVCVSMGVTVAQVPGSPIFIMKLASNVRHLEVQVLADQFGNTISLYGRCDTPDIRRHAAHPSQRLLGAAPPPEDH